MLNVNELIGFGAGGSDSLPHRWWRVRFLSPFNDGVTDYPGYATVRGCEIRLTPGGADQTAVYWVDGVTMAGIGGQPIGSNTSGGAPAYQPGVAFDNYWSTGWDNGQLDAAGQAWLGWVFDAPTAVKEFAFDTGNYNCDSLVIEYSDNGSSWYAAKTFTALNPWAAGTVLRVFTL